MKCCSARISVGAMKATWNPFSIATSAAISATIVLPDPTSPCSSRFIGCGRFMSVDDLADHLLLIAGELERQHAPGRFADVVGDDDRPWLALRVGLPPPQHETDLEEEELLEDQPALRRRAEPVQLLDRRSRRRKMHVHQRGAPVEQPLAPADLVRQRIRDVGRQLRQRLMDDRALHLRRQRSGLLVDRDDAAGVQRVVVRRSRPRRRRPLPAAGSRTAGSAAAARATSARACRTG